MLTGHSSSLLCSCVTIWVYSLLMCKTSYNQEKESHLNFQMILLLVPQSQDSFLTILNKETAAVRTQIGPRNSDLRVNWSNLILGDVHSNKEADYHKTFKQFPLNASPSVCCCYTSLGCLSQDDVSTVDPKSHCYLQDSEQKETDTSSCLGSAVIDTLLMLMSIILTKPTFRCWNSSLVAAWMVNLHLNCQEKVCFSLT